MGIEPLKFKQYPICHGTCLRASQGMSTKKAEKTYEALAKMEDDCKEAIGLVNELKKGILYNSISDSGKRELCDLIIKVLNK